LQGPTITAGIKAGIFPRAPTIPPTATTTRPATTAGPPPPPPPPPPSPRPLFTSCARGGGAPPPPHFAGAGPRPAAPWGGRPFLRSNRLSSRPRTDQIPTN